MNSAENTRRSRGIQYGCPRYTRQTRSIVIVLNILCDSGHRFEGWFASTDAFRSQCERQLVNCPHCQTSEVRLLPSAPHVRRAAVTPVESIPQPQPQPQSLSMSADAAGKLFQALAQAAKLAENVGERFPEEARRIHYEEAPARTIRGRASAEETVALLEEGIMVLPAPVPHEDEFH